MRLEGVVKRHGATTVLHGVDLAIEPGEFFVLLGPSGSGKTTTLRILAGLESVSAGRVLMDGVDVTTQQPGERDVAMVFQSYALYPHMTVAENIGFPLKMVGTPRAEIDAAVADGGGEGRHRPPARAHAAASSRAASSSAARSARAIVRQPRLFLLDEPLSNLDAKLRLETRLELHRLQRSLGVTTVYVTHDQEEAMTLADRIAVFMDGRIVQVGTPREVYATPQTADVAAFIGTPPMNLLPARWEGERRRDRRRARAGRDGPAARATSRSACGRRTCGIAERGLAATVERIEDLGDSAIVSLQSPANGCSSRRATACPTCAKATRCASRFAPEAAHLFDPGSGARL